MVGDMVSSCPLHISKVLCVMPLASLFCNLASLYYSILQCPSYVGHYKYPRSTHPDFKFG